jgi:Ni2+-binding GTPase involved in maturation of urease and hydrogenase
MDGRMVMKEGFNKELLNCITPSTMIVLNKMDLIEKEDLSKIMSYIKTHLPEGIPIHEVSCKTGEGMDEFWKSIYDYSYQK